jgi:hypothetical protein
VKLQKAKQELNEFLQANPELIPYQMSLNEYLSKGRTQQERMQILARHMTENLIELQSELMLLKDKLDKGI